MSSTRRQAGSCKHAVGNMVLEHKKSGRHGVFSRALCCKVWVLDVSCFEEQHLFHMHQFSISCDLEGAWIL